MKKEHWLYIIIAVLAIWIIASYATAPKTEAPTDSLDNATTTVGTDTDSDNTDDDTTATPTPTPGSTPTTSTNTDNSVAVSNQPAGDMVTVGRIAMTFSGWVAVHEDKNGVIGNILGAQRFDAGVYPSGTVELARGTVAGGKYYVMLHSDNGDHVFDYKVDTAYMSAGAPVMASFIAQ